MAIPLKDLLENVRVGERTVLDVAGDEKERKLTVELRKVHPEVPRPPMRQESPPRAHEFISALSLGDYLSRYGQKETVVFADPVNELMHAVIDERASAGLEILKMTPAVHPLWKPWLGVLGRKVPVEDFAEFVATNRRTIVEASGAACGEIDGKELSQLLSQVRASVQVEIHRSKPRPGSLPCVNGVLVTTRIQGVEEKGTVDMPDMLKLRVPLYVTTDPVDLEVDLALDADTEGNVSVLVTAGTVQEAKVQAFEAMVDTVRKATEAHGMVLTFGAPKHGAWNYLRELSSS